ncbi:universal stress protein [Rhodopseudomonas pseudopalustris]|nr:universal stress protein [Rhodopseudomonas pseudopalustris]MBB1092614.1 universal stress protein [Rhodopseudomonas palustris]SEO57573.1 Nucleotide-binding universal stress protein, UspA family [Rhodopseudomonas pseudopalustris]
MSLKSLVVFVESTDACEARIRYAARLALRHDAHLIGAFVLKNAWRNDRSDGFIQGGGAIREMLERHGLAERKALQDATQRFEALAGRENSSFEFRVLRDDDIGNLARLHCLHTDLVVVGHPAPGGLPSTWLPEQMLLSAGVPLLIVPQGWSDGPIANNVLLAWNASREARRAITDSLPILKAADSVAVVVVDAEKNPLHGHEPGADIAHLLSRHGVAVRVEQLQSKGTSVADTIRRFAAEDQSDLIVLGAYGHSRRRELLFGGVTQSLLSTVTVPTLIAH